MDKYNVNSYCTSCKKNKYYDICDIRDNEYLLTKKNMYFRAMTDNLYICENQTVYIILYNPTCSNIIMVPSVFEFTNYTDNFLKRSLYVCTDNDMKFDGYVKGISAYAQKHKCKKSKSLLAWSYNLNNLKGVNVITRIFKPLSNESGIPKGNIILDPGTTNIVKIETLDKGSANITVSLSWWEEPLKCKI